MHVCHELNTTDGPCGLVVHDGIASQFFHGKVHRRDLWRCRLFVTFPPPQCATQPITYRSGSSGPPSIAVAMASSRVLRGQSTALCGPRQMRVRRGRMLLGTGFELGKLLFPLGSACSEDPWCHLFPSPNRVFPFRDLCQTVQGPASNHYDIVWPGRLDNVARPMPPQKHLSAHSSTLVMICACTEAIASRSSLNWLVNPRPVEDQVVNDTSFSFPGAEIKHPGSFCIPVPYGRFHVFLFPLGAKFCSIYVNTHRYQSKSSHRPKLYQQSVTHERTKCASCVWPFLHGRSS